MPAARVTNARYLSGMASVNASTASSVIGSMRCRWIFGSLVPSHGEATIRRSRTAALKIPARIRWTTPTVAGARLRESCLTTDWMSLGSTEPSRLSPRLG